MRVITPSPGPCGFQPGAELGRIQLAGKANDPQLHERYMLTCEVCWGLGVANGTRLHESLAQTLNHVSIAKGKLTRWLR